MPKKPVPASDDAIRALAHQIWEDEGRPEGKAEIHWQQAAEALAKPTAKKPAAKKAASTPAKTKTSKPKAR